MAVLTALGIEKAWGDRLVLRGANLSVDEGERVGLVGVNGCGKSTLLRILGNAERSDGGRFDIRGRVELLEQEPVLQGETVGDAVRAALGWHTKLLASYESALAEGRLEEAAGLQDQLDHHGWDVGHRAEAMLSRVDAPPASRSLQGLSGGEVRRVALAKVLLSEPEVLLLDEPTNHLDAETVDWLQDWLQRFRGAVVIVTHDRYLLEAVATRIVEIEDGESVSYDGSYADYLIARAERRAALERAEDARLSMIAREAAWASRSPAARSTKQRARLDRLEALKAKRPLQRTSAMSLHFKTGLKQGQTVVEARDLEMGYGERTLFRKLDIDLLRGERLGILGPNGAGKSTLLRVLGGVTQPLKGQVVMSPKVRTATLDQHRSGLRDEDTVFEAAGGGNDRVRVGETWVHVAGYLQRFLFPKRMHDQGVASLSGGERARLLLAKMMLKGANLLLLDEPTNDLDLLTLRVLEEALLEFDGAAIIVTHDRAFLDRVCTTVIAFEETGETVRYADRQQAMRAAAQRRASADTKKTAVSKPKATPKPSAKKKLSYSDKQEFKALPAKIEALENELETLEEQLADPNLYTGDPSQARALQAELARVEAAMETAWERWADLEARGAEA